MKLSTLALTIAALALPMAPAMADDATTLIKRWQHENQLCRGGFGDNPKTLDACDRREKVAKLIKPTGWCMGRDGQPTAMETVHRCTKGSSNFDGSDYVGAATAKPYSELLKGTWRNTSHKSCKEAKTSGEGLFYNGLKFSALETDCIVNDTKEVGKSVKLKMICISEGERMQSNSSITFINDTSIQVDGEKYIKCSGVL